MDRTTPGTVNEEIELYMRTYYSLLRSSGQVEVRSLEETHSGMNASLHQGAGSPEIDLGAFIYCALRLPLCITNVRLMLLGQSGEVFSRGGYPDIESWTVFRTAARRRKMFFDGQETIAIFINSISDIDDLVPLLTTYQIEWNKMHVRLAHTGLKVSPETTPTPAHYQEALVMSDADFDKLRQIWGHNLLPTLIEVAEGEKRFAIRLLSGSRTDYRRATQGWWRSMIRRSPISDLRRRPIYFVSSNMHTMPNLFDNYIALIKDEVLDYLNKTNPEGLADMYRQIQSGELPSRPENLLYYMMRKFIHSPQGKHHYDLRLQHEISLGIHNLRQPLNLDVGVQLIDLSKLNPDHLDPRLRDLPGADWGKLAHSDALIVNLDYPLGMAAYHVLSQISANVGEVRGMYVMGKAATLNGRVGDVMVPNVVYDEHSRNTYLFRNCFEASDISPYLSHGTVFDNQKAVTVRGTLLQNRKFMHIFYQEGYTDIEMEAGPYLSAMYENLHPKRYPINEIVTLFPDSACDLGFLHYASDTPYSKRQSLLSKSLLYFGMDSTYATAIAICRRILGHEVGLI